MRSVARRTANQDRWRPGLTGIFGKIVLMAGLWCAFSANAAPAEQYSFDVEAYENQSVQWGGYAEIKSERMNLNTDAALYKLAFQDNPHGGINRTSGALQLEMGYSRDMAAFRGVFNTQSVLDDLDWSQRADIYEANLSLKPTPSATFDMGKKVYKWGKGYAWNPLGFIDRPKDPENPEEALEGYIGTGVDLIKSRGGALQTVALTAVALPVLDGVNEDFGDVGHMNFAAKLYLLYRDTDIDIAAFAGDSRTARYGVDFSRNLASHIEVHAEYAFLTRIRQTYLDGNGTVCVRERSVSQYLLGLRYLTENDITAIVEYYHNGAGFSGEELDRFYQRVEDALASESDSALDAARALSKKRYASAQAGRNYLYLKVNQKEPFDILYFTPGLIAIVNLDDQSFSVSPELVYTGFTNWELRLRGTRLIGGDFSEFAEKQNESKIELRLRYYF